MPLASTISCKGLSQPQIAAKGIHLHFTLPPPFLNYEIFFYHVKCVLDKNHGFGVRQTKTTKAVCAAQNHTLWMSYRQKALAFTPGQQGSHGEKLFRPLFMTHAIPGTRPTRLCRLPCPNLRLMLSTRCPWPHWFCLLQIKSKPPARNSAWSAQTSSVEQCHAEVCDSA